MEDVVIVRVRSVQQHPVREEMGQILRFEVGHVNTDDTDNNHLSGIITASFCGLCIKGSFLSFDIK